MNQLKLILFYFLQIKYNYEKNNTFVCGRLHEVGDLKNSRRGRSKGSFTVRNLLQDFIQLL
jgi:hypothetical protein